MPAPKSNWIAKSQQMMYPIEMQAIGMSNQANAQIAQSIERTGQRVQEIQLKKQAFAEHHQRTMMMQAAENQKMALQDRAMLQEATKIDLERQRIQLQRDAGTQKEFQSTIGTVSRDEHGNIRVAHPGASPGDIAYETFKPTGDRGEYTDEDYQKIDRERGLYAKARSPMDRNTDALKAGRLQQQQRDVKESDIKLLKRELDEIKERHDSAKEKFEGFRLDQVSWGKVNEVFRGEPHTWKGALKANQGKWGLDGRVDAIIEAHEEMTQAKKEGTAKLAEWKGRVGDVVGGR